MGIEKEDKMKNPREKYLNDNMYRVLVDMMVEQIDQCNYTPSEMREAAVLASIIYEERNPPGYSISMSFVDGKRIDVEQRNIISGVETVLTPTRSNEIEEYED